MTTVARPVAAASPQTSVPATAPAAAAAPARAPPRTVRVSTRTSSGPGVTVSRTTSTRKAEELCTGLLLLLRPGAPPVRPDGGGAPADHFGTAVHAALPPPSASATARGPGAGCLRAPAGAPASNSRKPCPY